MNTWPRLNPGFQYVLWDDAACAAAKFQNADKIAAAKDICGKADLIRYEILARHGGIYVDADIECVRPLDESLLDGDAWLCWEDQDEELLANCVLACAPRNSFFEMLVDECSRQDPNADAAWISTGPKFVTNAARSIDFRGLTIHPAYLFMPVHHTGRVHPGAARGPVYGNSYWGSTKGAYDGTRTVVTLATLLTVSVLGGRWIERR